MDTSDDNYHISLFKPKTPQATANRNMVILFFCIWAVAIFGFQILLKIFEKPVPETTLITFEKVWPSVKDGSASEEQLATFSASVLSVLGKISIKPEHSAILQNALSWSVYQLAGEGEKEALYNLVQDFERKKREITSISDPIYTEARNTLSERVAPLLQLNRNDIRAKILPMMLNSADMETFHGENSDKLHQSMSVYLIHNRSFLTDIRFLGFPFHYFYTAIFLLVLFVGLCLLYCVRTDAINARFNIAD